MLLLGSFRSRTDGDDLGERSEFARGGSEGYLHRVLYAGASKTIR